MKLHLTISAQETKFKTNKHTHTHTKEKKRKRTKKYHKQHQTVMLSNSQSDLLTLTFYCKKNNYWLERQLESLKFTNQKQG